MSDQSEKKVQCQGCFKVLEGSDLLEFIFVVKGEKPRINGKCPYCLNFVGTISYEKSQLVAATLNMVCAISAFGKISNVEKLGAIASEVVCEE